MKNECSLIIRSKYALKITATRCHTSSHHLFKKSAVYSSIKKSVASRSNLDSVHRKTHYIYFVVSQNHESWNQHVNTVPILGALFFKTMHGQSVQSGRELSYGFNDVDGGTRLCALPNFSSPKPEYPESTSCTRR